MAPARMEGFFRSLLEGPLGDDASGRYAPSAIIPEPALLHHVAGHGRADRRAVRSGSELLDVLVDSLARYQEELHGPGHQIDELWNEQEKQKGPDVVWPQNERRFRDSVKRHLERDLRDQRLIVNREVEFRLGERTDIHVDAVAPETGAVFTVVIEAKGCWNPELLTAMETQLADRYLADSHVGHGLYLVGRFQCPDWSEQDKTQKTRKAKSAKQAPNLEPLRHTLSHQAQDLSKARNKDIRAVVIDAAWRRTR